MAKIRAITVIVTVLLVFPTYVWSASKYPYLIDATSRIIQLNSQSMSPSPDELRRAATEACKAVEQLLRDDSFRKDLDNMVALDEKTRAQRDEMRQDLTLFVSGFLRPEETALKKAGLKDEALKEILWSASMFRQALADKYNPNRIIDAIDKFRLEVCKEATTLTQKQDVATRVAKLRKWAFRIGGLALIVVDSSLAIVPATAAVMAPMAPGSAAVGGAIMTWE